MFIGRTDAKAETPILWPPDTKEATHWKRLMLGENEGRRRRRQQRMRQQRRQQLAGITDSMDMSLSTLWEIIKDQEGRHAAVHKVAKSWTQLSS